MSDEMNDGLELQAAALEQLKARAERLGVGYHPSISARKLSEKLSAHLATLEDDEAEPVPSPLKETAGQTRKRLIEEQTRLVRVRVSCMNPFKKDWDGEIFTTGNSLVGTIKKFVPFDNDEGWHIPQIMLNLLQERECQLFVTQRTKNGVPINQSKMVKEFSIELLPPLSMDEMKDLAQQQAMANRI